MSSLETKTRPYASTDDNASYHYWCCDEDVSLCGLDISEIEEGIGEGETLCIVCDDLDFNEDYKCPECGL